MKKLLQFSILSVVVYMSSMAASPPLALWAASLTAPILIDAIFIPPMPGSSSSVPATTATNIGGGSAYSVPYQTAASSTAFVSSVANSVIVTSASGLPSESTTLPPGLTIPSPALTGTTTAQTITAASGIKSYGGSVPFTLSQTSVPVGIAPTGTTLGSSTGAVTLGTALPSIYSNATSAFANGLYLYY